MDQRRCLECNAQIGGQNHQPAQGNIDAYQ